MCVMFCFVRLGSFVFALFFFRFAVFLAAVAAAAPPPKDSQRRVYDEQQLTLRLVSPFTVRNTALLLSLL